MRNRCPAGRRLKGVPRRIQTRPTTEEYGSIGRRGRAGGSAGWEGAPNPVSLTIEFAEDAHGCRMYLVLRKTDGPVEVNDAVLQSNRAGREVLEQSRQLRKQARPGGDLLSVKPHFVLFRLSLVGAEVALVDAALHQKPRGHLHQSRRQPHTFGCISCGKRHAATFSPHHGRVRQDKPPPARQGPSRRGTTS